MTGYFSHHESQSEPGIPDVQPEPIVKNQTEKTLAAVIPEAEVELDWKDIIQLLKQKLTIQAFDKTLRYLLQFHGCKNHRVVNVKNKRIVLKLQLDTKGKCFGFIFKELL